MNYLQLCQFTQRQLAAGNDLPANPMTTTVGQTGYLYEITQWVQDSYRTIQNEQDNWLFRTLQGVLPLNPNGQITWAQAQIQAALPLYDRNLFFVFPNSSRYLLSYAQNAGPASAAYCYYIPYQRWRGWRDRGTIPTGQPQYFTSLPADGALQFYPIPDTGDVTNANYYNLSMDYYRTLDAFTTDVSNPIIPVDFHEAIAWGAIMQWAAVRQSEPRMMLAKMEYERIMNDARHSQLPEDLVSLDEFFG